MSQKQIEGAKVALLAGILALQVLTYFQDQTAVSAYIVGADPGLRVEAEITNPADIEFPNPMPVCIDHGTYLAPCDDEIDVGTVGSN